MTPMEAARRYAEKYGVTVENAWRASHDASLGVGHIWTEVACPAYRSLEPGDCTCRAVNTWASLSR